MYNSYEEYMQTVLGVRPEGTYGAQGGMPYFEPRYEDMNLQEVNKLYPEIYKIVYPMVQKACGARNISVVNEAQINEIVEEVYNAIEPGEIETRSRDESRNGDVKNPRAKETRRPVNNSWMRDLIKILILRELLPGNWGPRTTGLGPRKTAISRWTSEDHHLGQDQVFQDHGGPRRTRNATTSTTRTVHGGRPPVMRARIHGYVLGGILQKER